MSHIGTLITTSSIQIQQLANYQSKVTIAEFELPSKFIKVLRSVSKIYHNNLDSIFEVWLVKDGEKPKKIFDNYSIVKAIEEYNKII